MGAHKNIRLVALFFLLLLSAPQALWAAGWGGAMGGMGAALSEAGRQQALADQERERIEYEHKLEIQRMERQHQLNMEYQTGLRSPPAPANLPQSRASQGPASADEERWLEQTFPAWRQTISTPEFRAWRERQPDSIKALASSPYAVDAIRMLNLYESERFADARPQ